MPATEIHVEAEVEIERTTEIQTRSRPCLNRGPLRCPTVSTTQPRSSARIDTRVERTAEIEVGVDADVDDSAAEIDAGIKT